MSAEAGRVKGRTGGEVMERGDIKQLTSDVLRLQDRGPPAAVFKKQRGSESYARSSNPAHFKTFRFGSC